MVEPGKILVIQLRRIGDVLMVTPALAALRARFPEARIDFLTEPPSHELLEGNPFLGKVHVYRSDGMSDYLSWLRKVRSEGYDWVVDYMGNPRSAILTAASSAAVRAGPAHVGHRWAYNHRMLQSSNTHYAGREKVRVLSGLGVPDDGRKCLPEIYLGLERGGRTGGPIALIPASRRTTRRWPARRYAELGRMLRERFGCSIRVLWGPGEKDLADEVVRGIGEGAEAPETRTLKEAAALLSGCRLVVTNCNGPKHIAVALGVPTLTIHGSSDPASWTPADRRHAALRRSELACIGCGLNRCPYGLECLGGLSPGRVFESACGLMEAVDGPS